MDELYAKSEIFYADAKYRTEEDFKDSVKSYGLLWSWDEVTVDTSEVRNLADYGVDVHNLGKIPEAVNIIDTRA